MLLSPISLHMYASFTNFSLHTLSHIHPLPLCALSTSPTPHTGDTCLMQKYGEVCGQKIGEADLCVCEFPFKFLHLWWMTTLLLRKICIESCVVFEKKEIGGGEKKWLFLVISGIMVGKAFDLFVFCTIGLHESVPNGVSLVEVVELRWWAIWEFTQEGTLF